MRLSQLRSMLLGVAVVLAAALRGRRRDRHPQAAAGVNEPAVAITLRYMKLVPSLALFVAGLARAAVGRAVAAEPVASLDGRRLRRGRLRAPAVAAALASLMLPASALAQAAPERLGEQSTLVIPMFVSIAPGFSPTDCVGTQVSDYKATPRLTAAGLSSALRFSTDLEFFYQANSYGQTRFDFEVLENPDGATDADPKKATADGWWRAPNTLNTYCGKSLFVGPNTMVGDAVTGIYQAAIRAGQARPPSAYRRIVVVVNKDSWGGATYGGFATYSLAAKDDPATARTVTASLVNENASDQSLRTVLRHELGHQLRLSAHYYGRIDDSATAANERIPCPRYPSAAEVECLGPWDPLGDAGWGTEFSAYSRVEAGWLPDDGSHVVELPLLGGPSPFALTIGMAPLEAGENELAGTVRQRYRAVRVPTVSANPFKGYYVECRRRTGFDANRLDATGKFMFGLPADGVLVTYVDEPNKPRLFAVRVHGPEDLYRAPLQPGESFATPAVNGSQLVIRHNGNVSAGPGPAFCSVTLSKKAAHPRAAVGLLPPPLASNGDIDEYRSSDVWVDAKGNGTGKFPRGQATFTENGVQRPLGPGDPPRRGRPSRVWFQLRNTGTAVARRLKVTVRVARSPLRSCHARILGFVRIRSLAPGAAALRSVPWTPQDSQGRIEVRLNRVGRDATRDDDVAAMSFAAVAVPTRGRPRAATTIRLPAGDGCANPVGLAAQPVGLRSGWNATLSPAIIGRHTRALRARVRAVSPRARAKPFALAFTRLDIHHGPNPTPPGASQRFQDDPFLRAEDEPAGGVALLAGLARRSALRLRCPGAVGAGEPVAVGGALSPALVSAPIVLEYSRASTAVAFRHRLTRSRGRFADSFTPARPGRWTLRASWGGSAARFPALSRVCHLRVSPHPHRPWPNLRASGLSGRSVTIRNVGDAASGPFAVIMRTAGGPADVFSIRRLGVRAAVTRALPCQPGERSVTTDALDQVREGPFEADNDAHVLVASCDGNPAGISGLAALKDVGAGAARAFVGANAREYSRTNDTRGGAIDAGVRGEPGRVSSGNSVLHR